MNSLNCFDQCDFTFQGLKKESDQWRYWLELERKIWNVVLYADICHSGRYLSRFMMADFLKTLNGQCSYWVICHEDEHIDDDEKKPLKGIHWHLVLKFGKKIRRQSVISLICSFFEVDPVVLDLSAKSDFLGTPKVQPWVQIQPTSNDIGSVRYLTHIDNPEKKQYLTKDVMTNYRDFLNGCMLLDSGDLNGDTLIKLVTEVCYCSKTQVMRFLGLERYCRFRMAVSDICDEFKRDGVSIKQKKGANA